MLRARVKRSTNQRLQFFLVNKIKLTHKVVEMLVARVDVRFLHNKYIVIYLHQI